MIRFIRPDELNTLIELCKQHAEYEKADFDPVGKKEALKKAIFSHAPSVYCLVAVEGEEIIGYATFMPQFSTWDANHYLYLDCLFLREKARGMGLGVKLLLAVKEEALKHNCSLIQWHTPNFNVDAIRFYKRIGAGSNSKERFFWDITD